MQCLTPKATANRFLKIDAVRYSSSSSSELVLLEGKQSSGYRHRALEFQRLLLTYKSWKGRWSSVPTVLEDMGGGLPMVLRNKQDFFFPRAKKLYTGFSVTMRKRSVCPYAATYISSICNDIVRAEFKNHFQIMLKKIEWILNCYIFILFPRVCFFSLKPFIINNSSVNGLEASGVSISSAESSVVCVFSFGFIISPPVSPLSPYLRCIFSSEGFEDQCALLLEALGKIKCKQVA